MKAGYFNLDEYLEKLYEEAEKQQKTTGFMAGGEGLSDNEGIVIPDTNKKSYDWLKKEYQKGKTEVKVEMKMGGAKFEPGYDLQTDLDSVKDFKPGMFGEIKTGDTSGKEKGQKAPAQKPGSLSTDKKNPNFGKEEGEKKEEKTGQKPETKPEKTGQKPETNPEKKDITNKGKSEKPEGKEEKEEKEEKGEKEKKGDEDKTEVKKIDLKTKKK